MLKERLKIKFDLLEDRNNPFKLFNWSDYSKAERQSRYSFFSYNLSKRIHETENHAALVILLISFKSSILSDFSSSRS